MLGRHSLAKEITVILCIKGLLLFILWFICFSHPQDKLPAYSIANVYAMTVQIIINNEDSHAI